MSTKTYEELRTDLLDSIEDRVEPCRGDALKLKLPSLMSGFIDIDLRWLKLDNSLLENPDADDDGCLVVTGQRFITTSSGFSIEKVEDLDDMSLADLASILVWLDRAEEKEKP